MLALVQRVCRAHVEVDGRAVGAIDRGLLAFVCALRDDDMRTAERLVDKLLKLRVFADDAGRMNRSVADVAGGLLIVSQFTLAADASRGHRPSFSAAAGAERGRELYDHVIAEASRRHAPVASGVFGAAMRVHLVNDGPVTIPLDVRG